MAGKYYWMISEKNTTHLQKSSLGKLDKTVNNLLELFTLWFEVAVQKVKPEGNAMCLSKVNAENLPSSRMVLFKKM